MSRRPWVNLAVLLGCFAALWLAVSRQTAACPFCSAVSQTFSEELATMDVAVIARLLDAPKLDDRSAAAVAQRGVPKAKFEIVDVLKGESLVEGRPKIETIYIGEGNYEANYLLMGLDPPDLTWAAPMALSDRARDYLLRVIKLPPEGADRLVFFQQYLEDDDEILSQDAYDEFARAPYSVVQSLKPRMKHDQLVNWIKDPEVPASRRRLYFTMLGVCGDKNDLPMLELMLKSNDRTVKAGLDSMIACYLTLSGEKGMPLIEETLLKNSEAEYADTYAAIMALRFHGTETNMIPKKRILEGFHHMLARPELADLIIPDLARWQDWSQMDRLVELFKDADDKSSWVRVPVVRYLMACPLPEAKKHIDSLKKIDGAAVQRAYTFFPFPAAASAPSGDSGTDDKEEADKETSTEP